MPREPLNNRAEVCVVPQVCTSDGAAQDVHGQGLSLGWDGHVSADPNILRVASVQAGEVASVQN